MTGDVSAPAGAGLFGLDIMWSILLFVVLIGMAATTFRLMRTLQEGQAQDIDADERRFVGDPRNRRTWTRVRVYAVSSGAAIIVVTMFLTAMGAEQILPNFSDADRNGELGAVDLVENPSRPDAQMPMGARRCPEGRMALTFDDGPHPDHTPLVLNILDEHEVVANFFVRGDRVEEYPELMLDVIDEGHLIGNHSWDHPDLLDTSAQEVADQLGDTNAIVYEVTEQDLDFWRPPFGSHDASVRMAAEEAGLEMVMWTYDLDIHDWQMRAPKTLVATVEDNLQDGGIILAHDGVTGSVNTIAALPHIIDAVHEAGYCFGKVSESYDWVKNGEQ